MLKLRRGSGNRRTLADIGGLADKTKRGIRQAFFALGDDLMKELNQQMLAKNKRGRVYISKDRRGRTRRHRASAPGQTPANRSGFLRRSRDYKITGAEQLEFGVAAPYGRFLEQGTRRMEARPGLKNTVKATERNARLRFTTGVRGEFLKR